MKGFVFFSALLLSSLFLVANFSISNAQSNVGSLSNSDNAGPSAIDSDGNRSSTINNRSLEFRSQVNISEAAEVYERYQSLEAPPPQEAIDKEAGLQAIEERAEEVKEDIENLESPLPAEEEEVFRFDANEIMESSSPVQINSSQSVGSEPFSNTSLFNITNQTSTTEQSETTASANVSTTITKKWSGLNVDTASRGDTYSIPPDITLAVGPDHVVQMVHSAMRIWDKNGQEIQSVFLDDLFGPDQSHVLSDPVIDYDPETERWFAAIMEISPQPINAQGEVDSCYYDCSILIAVSLSNDPSSNWNIFQVPFGRNLADYPMIGISDNYFAFGVNVLSTPTLGLNNWLGTQAVLMDKNSLVQNSPSIPIYSSPLYLDYYGIYPVTSNTECMYMQANHWPLRLWPSFTDGIVLLNFCSDSPTNGINITSHRVPIPITVFPIEADQPNNIKADTGLFPPRGPVFFNNTIISAFNYACDNEDGIRQSCIRLLEIEIGSTNSTTTATGFSANEADVFYPSLSLGKDGKIVMVFGVSSEERFPSLMVARFDKGFENMELIPLVDGNANTNSHLDEPRFGDYFESETDPLDGSVWVTGEYGDRNLPSRWSTHIGNIP